MSGLNINNSRVQFKFSTISGVTPTIAPSTDFTDGTWLDTDLYVGEFFLNAADNMMWIRTLTGIVPITSGSTSIDISAFVNKTGDTMSGNLYLPALSATTISGNTIYSNHFDGNFYGDGSNLTGITATTFTGGTISGPTTFTDTVDFCSGSVTLDSLSSCGDAIDIFTNLNVIGAISGNTFYGDGSNLSGISASYEYIDEDVSLQSLALSGSSTIIFDVEDANYKNYTQRDSYLLNSQIEDKLINGDTTNIIQGFTESGAIIGLNVKNSGNTINSLVNVSLGIIELKTESDLDDRLITQTISDDIVTNISIPSIPGVHNQRTLNAFQDETVINNDEYTITETKDSTFPKSQTLITQSFDDTQALRQQYYNQIYDEVSSGIQQASSTLTVEAINHSVLSDEGQEDYININNEGVTLGEVQGSSYTNFIVNNDNGFYKSQFHSTDISRGVSKERFVSFRTTGDTSTSVVYPLTDLEIETGTIAFSATITALNFAEDKSYVCKIESGVRLNSYIPTIFGLDTNEKSEFTTATSTLDIESSNLSIFVTGEAGTTIDWSIKYELTYSV